MIHLFKSAVSRVVSLTLVATIVVGILIGAVRLALPFADLFRSKLEDRLSQTLGLNVEVDHFGLALAGIAPRLSLHGAKLVDPGTGRVQLSLDQLQIDLDLGATLKTRSPQIDAVTLVGAHLVAKREQDGSVTIAGLEGIQGGDPAAVTFFLGNGRFLLTHSDIQWVPDPSHPPALWLTDVRMRLDNAGDRHRIGLRAAVFGDRDSRLHLVGDLKGEPGNPTGWRGEIYAAWKGRDVGTIAHGLLPAGWRLRTAGGTLESWAHWKGGTFKDALAQIHFTGLEGSRDPAGDAPRRLALDSVSGVMQWRSLDKGWRLSATSLVLARDGVARSPTDLSIGFDSVDGRQALAGAASLFEIADARAVLGLFLATGPDSPLESWLANAEASGTVRDLRLRLAKPRTGVPTWAASGEVVGLGFAPHGGVPGLRGLSATFSADDAHGRAEVQSTDLAFTLPAVFREPIRANHIVGELYWRRNADGGLRIETPEMIADNADIATRSRLVLTLPPDWTNPFVDLQTDFRDGDASAVRHYLPVGVLKPDLVHWLDTAFVSGRVPSGTLIFRGFAADYPFRQNEGRFEVVFGAVDGILDYHADWPRLEEVVGEVRFENQGFEASVSDASFLESEVQDAHARIPDLFHPVSVQIEGSVQGPFADGLRTLRETPLKDKFGPLAASFRAEGDSRVDLDMAVPLHKEVPLVLKGRLSWPSPARLLIPDWDLTLTDLGGGLAFTETALSADDLAARLWGVPLRIRIDTTAEAGDSGAAVTRLRAQAPLTSTLLTQHLPSPLWDLARGQAVWDFTLDIRSSDLTQVPLPLNFGLSSGLEGLAVTLPAPLGKTPTERKAFRAEGRLARGEDLRVQGEYGDLGFNLGFQRDATGRLLLTRSAVDLAGGLKPLPKNDGLVLTGTLPSLDLGTWLNWRAGQGRTRSGELPRGIELQSADVRIERLQLAKMSCSALQLKLQRGPGQWEGRLDSPDLVGSVDVPDRPRSRPVQIDLEHLDLKSLLTHEGKAGAALDGDAKGTDPREANTLDLNIARLLWGDNLLGSVAVRAEPSSDGLRFEQVSLDGPLMTVSGSGSWTRDGGAERTAVVLTASGKDLGEFLRELDFDSVLSKAPTTASVNVEWPGGPFQFALAGLRGRVDAKVGAGSLLDVEPGLGRVFGVLNLGALRRRLALDFSDIFERGYGFEEMKGALTIRDGKASIDHLTIKGPSAAIEVSGSTDLAGETFDQVVTVTPRIGPGVAVASAVAGGPLVGAAVYLADRVTGGAVDKLASYQYRITGPWKEPDIRRTTAGVVANGAPPKPPTAETGAAGSESERDQASTQKENSQLPGRDTPKNLFLDNN
jgi:uncharacterized protein (TIGR02099 family)